MDFTYLLNQIVLIFHEPQLILLTALGVFAGIYIGAIPGLSGTMAVSILVSFTFGWELNTSLALMIGIFVGVVYGGSRSAILLKIPGAPAAVATSFDGYPLAKKGKAGYAMGVATTQSVIGTYIGIIALIFLAPLISKLALNFHSVDYLLLSVAGLALVGSAGGKSLASGLIGGCIGLFLGTIGIDSMTSVKRFTFDFVYLNSGVNYIVAMIGLFGAAEAFYQIAKIRRHSSGDGEGSVASDGETAGSANGEIVKQDTGKILPGFRTAISHVPLTLLSAITGVIIGALPGAGGDVAAIFSYELAKRMVKPSEAPYGQGAIEGVIAPETANNAAIGGAFIPMLTLGIPGDSITAVLISALAIHGIQAGPTMYTSRPDVFWIIVCFLIIGGIFLVIFGLTGIRLFVKAAEVPKHILMPIILMLCIVGAFAIRSNLLDIFWMFGFGLLGYFLKSFDFPVSPIVLGLILEKLFEENLRRGLLLEGSIGGVALSVFESPISIVLAALLLLIIVAGVIKRK